MEFLTTKIWVAIKHGVICKSCPHFFPAIFTSGTLIYDALGRLTQTDRDVYSLHILFTFTIEHKAQSPRERERERERERWGERDRGRERWVRERERVVYPFTNPSVTVPRAPITTAITVTYMFHIFFSIPKKGSGTYSSFHFLLILLCCQPKQQSLQFGKFSFLADYYKVWSSGRYEVIHLYLKIPEEFVRLILRQRFWIWHMPFVRMVTI